VYLATRNNTSWHYSGHFGFYLNSMPSTDEFRGSSISVWLPANTRATRSCCANPDIATAQVHITAPIRLVNFEGCGSHGYYNMQHNPQLLRCWCCCNCVSFGQVCSCAVLTFPVTRFLRVRGKWKVSFQVSAPVLFKNSIIIIQASLHSGCVCPFKIPWERDRWLFPKVGFQGYFINCRCQKCYVTIVRV
jgi:hypothetical protein